MICTFSCEVARSRGTTTLSAARITGRRVATGLSARSPNGWSGRILDRSSPGPGLPQDNLPRGPDVPNTGISRVG